MQSQLRDLSSTLTTLKKMMFDKGFFDTDDCDKSKKGKRPAIGVNGTILHSNKNNKDTEGILVPDQTCTGSETTIYKNAVEFQENEELINVDQEVSFRMKKKNRESSSSEEPIDTSDEIMEIDINEQFIADCAEEHRRKDGGHRSQLPEDRHHDNSHENHKVYSEQIIREVEASRARMYKAGKEFASFDFKAAEHSAIVYKSYMMVGAHLEKSIQIKILNHEYVDFARLVTKDRVSKEDDHRMELINKGGTCFLYWSRTEKRLISQVSANGSRHLGYL